MPNPNDTDDLPPLPPEQDELASNLISLIHERNWGTIRELIASEEEVPDVHMLLDVDGDGDPETTLFGYALANHMPQATLAAFIARGASLEREFWIVGALEENWDFVNLLLTYNPDVSATPLPPHPSSGITVLDMAIRRGQWQLAKILWDRSSADARNATLGHFGYPGIVASIMAQPAPVIAQLFERLAQRLEDADCPLSFDFILDPVYLIVRQGNNLVREQQVYDRRSISQAHRAMEELAAEMGQERAFPSPLTRAPVVSMTPALDRAREIEHSVQMAGLEILEQIQAAQRALTGERHPGEGATSPPRPTRENRQPPPTPQFRKRPRQYPPSPGSP